MEVPPNAIYVQMKVKAALNDPREVLRQLEREKQEALNQRSHQQVLDDQADAKRIRRGRQRRNKTKRDRIAKRAIFEEVKF